MSFVENKVDLVSSNKPLAIQNLISNKNIVNGNVNQLDKEPNESHDEKADTCRLGDLHKFLSIGFRTFLDQMRRVLGKLPQWLDEHLIESFLFHIE